MAPKHGDKSCGKPASESVPLPAPQYPGRPSYISACGSTATHGGNLNHQSFSAYYQDNIHTFGATAARQSPTSRSQDPKNYSYLAPSIPLQQKISVEAKSNKICSWPGCGLGFRENDVLLKHERRHTAQNLQCAFCLKFCKGHAGLKSHTLRHCVRVEYCPGAQRVYDAM